MEELIIKLSDTPSFSQISETAKMLKFPSTKNEDSLKTFKPMKILIQMIWMLSVGIIFTLQRTDTKILLKKFFNNKILGLFDKHVPKVTKKITKKRAPWLTYAIKLMI